LREIRDKKGNNAEGKRLQTILKQLELEVLNKKYYMGLLGFLNEASSQLNDWLTDFQNLQQQGTMMD